MSDETASVMSRFLMKSSPLVDIRTDIEPCDDACNGIKALRMRTEMNTIAVAIDDVSSCDFQSLYSSVGHSSL